MMSTPSEVIRSCDTWALTEGVAWLSLLMTSTSYFLPPDVMPLANAFLARLITYGSGSPKPAAGPVNGLTNPILIVPAVPPPDPEPEESLLLLLPQAAAAPPNTRPPTPRPRRVTRVGTG